MSRRPDALFNPQFFGEDGAVWYRDAYVFGWFTSLLHSQNGYFQTLPRLAAALALIVPLRFAPLVMNIVGITVQVLPVNILLSARCRNWAPLGVRAWMAVAYLALPNTHELDATVEEGQWRLALLACLLILASIPSNWKWRVFDVAIFLLSGVTGPFGLILLPVSVIFWWFRRERRRLIAIAIFAAACIVQISALLRSASATRTHAALGASAKLFLQILAKQVYLGALRGERAVSDHYSVFALASVILLATAVLVYSFLKAPLEFKLFILFSECVFAAALKNPMVSDTLPQWPVLLSSPGIRYWFFPMLAFVWALIYCAGTRGNLPMRVFAVIGFLIVCGGALNDWQYPAYPNFDFPRYARQFASASPGTLIRIPICPAGWMMRLTKKSPQCHTPPIGIVDEPSEGARVGGPIAIAGWVAGAKPVSSVSIYVDHTLIQSVKPDFARPDVDSFYPDSPVRYKGWRAILDMSKVTPGPHEIEIGALAADGCAGDFFALRVERTK